MGLGYTLSCNLSGLVFAQGRVICDPKSRELAPSSVKENADVISLPDPKKPDAFSVRVEGMACESCVERVEKGYPRNAGRCLGLR